MSAQSARWTRRAFTWACTTLPFAGKAQAQATTQGTPQPPAQTAALAARVDAASHLSLDVTINGLGPYHFVVDTGAERSVVADTVAAALNLPAGPTVMVDGISGRIAVPTVNVERLNFGPFRRKRLNLPVLSRPNLQADGYLGLDAIDGTRITFDFAHKVIRMEERSGYAFLPVDTSTRIRATGSGGYLRITDGRVENVFVTAFVDTGAEVTVGNPALYDALKRNSKSLVELGPAVLSGVTGGQLPGVVIPVRRIHLQDLLFSDGTIVIADPPDFTTWRLHDRPALLIGLDYLRQFASVTIDYRDQQLRFDLAEITPRPTPTVSISQMG